MDNAKAGRCHARPVDETSQCWGQLYPQHAVAPNAAFSPHHRQLPGATQEHNGATLEKIPPVKAVFPGRVPRAARKALGLRVKWGSSSSAPRSVPGPTVTGLRAGDPAASQSIPPAPHESHLEKAKAASKESELPVTGEGTRLGDGRSWHLAVLLQLERVLHSSASSLNGL